MNQEFSFTQPPPRSKEYNRLQKIHLSFKATPLYEGWIPLLRESSRPLLGCYDHLYYAVQDFQYPGQVKRI